MRTRHRPGLVVVLVLALASCDDGDDAARCSPGEDPRPGCALSDCVAHRNDCGGTVYACSQTGEVVELGTCELGPADAGPPSNCTPGGVGVPGCSMEDCSHGVNMCGGAVFICDSTGTVVQNGFCSIDNPIDGGSAPADAAIVVDAGG